MNQTHIKEINELNQDVNIETEGVPMMWHHKSCRTSNLFAVKGRKGLYCKNCGRWVSFSEVY